MITILLRWPHQGMILGYELFHPVEGEDYWTVRLHVVIFSIYFEWGNDINDIFEE